MLHAELKKKKKNFDSRKALGHAEPKKTGQEKDLLRARPSVRIS